MKHISLFSGIGGFDLAATWAGWDNIVSCEINPFCNKVLKYYWPDAYHHNDIKTLTYEKINENLSAGWDDSNIVISGGFPCQPYSLAGKRKGKDDDRHLWPEMLRVIREVQPRWVVGENVFGLINWDGGMVFDEVQSDLETEGYEVQPYVLPACAVNAPHRRDRVWFVAKNAMQCRCIHGEPFKEGAKNGQFGDVGTRNTDRIYISAGHIADTKSVRHEQSRDTRPRRPRLENDDSNDDTNAKGERCERGLHEAGCKKTERPTLPHGTWSVRPGWQNFPTQSPICSGDDGLSAELDGITFSKWRNESIKAYGNAVVPQVVYQIFKAINEYEERARMGLV